MVEAEEVMKSWSVLNIISRYSSRISKRTKWETREEESR